MSAVPGQIVVQKPGGSSQVIYSPFWHQQQFHASTTKHCILGGGAGSGKSFCMRMDAILRCLSIPRFRALIVRRQMPELRKSHLEELPFDLERLGLPATSYHQTHNIVRFPNGSSLLFDHVEDDQSLSRFLSAEFAYIALDEMCTFTLKQYKFLASRARTTIPGLTPLIRGGTNPVGIGASWVRRYYVTKSVTFEGLKPEDENYRPEDYEYIHCTARDNPALNADYWKALGSLPSAALVSAMRDGEWSIEGAMFPEWAPHKDGRPWHVIGRMPTYHGQPIQFAPHIEIVRVIDWGYAEEGNPGVCLWFACLPDGSAICFKEHVFKLTLPEDAAREILRLSEGLRVKYTVGDSQMWAEHTGPSVAEKFAGVGLGMIEADKEREAGWLEFHAWLRQTVDDGSGPRPRISFLETGCPHTIRTLPDMAVDPKNPADMLTVGVEDDSADDCRYFVMSRPGRSREPSSAPPTPPLRREIEALIQKKKRTRFRMGAEATRRSV